MKHSALRCNTQVTHCGQPTPAGRSRGHLLGKPPRPAILVILSRRARPIHPADLRPVVLDRPLRPGVLGEQCRVDLHQRPQVPDRCRWDLLRISRELALDPVELQHHREPEPGHARLVRDQVTGKVHLSRPVHRFQALLIWLKSPTFAACAPILCMPQAGSTAWAYSRNRVSSSCDRAVWCRRRRSMARRWKYKLGPGERFIGLEQGNALGKAGHEFLDPIGQQCCPPARLAGPPRVTSQRPCRWSIYSGRDFPS